MPKPRITKTRARGLSRKVKKQMELKGGLTAMEKGAKVYRNTIYRLAESMTIETDKADRIESYLNSLKKK